VRIVLRPISLVVATAAATVVAGAPPAAAQTSVPKIARGQFDARLTIPGTKTVYHRRWRLSPSCLGANCASIRLRMERPDKRFDAVTLRRDGGVYRGRLRTRGLCRGRLAKRAGTISVALRVTRTVRRDMVSGRETIITDVGGELRITSELGACPPRRHMGRRARVTADRIDLPEALLPDFHTAPAAPSVSGRTNTVQFADASAPPDQLVAWQWNFGDPASGAANTASGRTVSHTFTRAGTYRIVLTIADSWGQVASLTGPPFTVLP
jgi:hypothetical protein